MVDDHDETLDGVRARDPLLRSRTGVLVLVPNAESWVARLTDAHCLARLPAELARLRRYGLIIIDEVGYLPFEQDAATLVFQLVSSRYEHASLILTSNLPFSGWGGVFGDQAVGAAMIDRIVHHADVLTLKAPATGSATAASTPSPASEPAPTNPTPKLPSTEPRTFRPATPRSFRPSPTGGPGVVRVGRSGRSIQQWRPRFIGSSRVRNHAGDSRSRSCHNSFVSGARTVCG